MVSALWNACSSGDADAVRDILNDASPADIDAQGPCLPMPTTAHSPPADQFGVTPLIEAVRNAHIDIVKALLDKGADPTHGLPETYTSDPAIIDLLRRKASAPEDSYQYPSHKPYQYPAPPPPVGYPYYAEAAGFYPAEGGVPGGIGNLPPPDIARYIPCRYFPACRYGASCMFAHPQQYYPGSIPPPAPYVAPYDPINVQQYPPSYFPPPPFQPNAVHPMSPPPHGPSPSDLSVPVQPPFSPNPIPPAPYGPMSPSAYPHPGQTPLPMIMAPLPPPHHPAPVYNSAPSSAPSYPQPDGSVPFPVKADGTPQEFNPDAKSPNPQDASGVNNHQAREGPGHRRGGRRTSFTGRRPPCLFFPAGRCKNGDECRYPHVTPEGNPPHHNPYFSARGPKPPRQPNGNPINNITDKMGGLNVRDDAPAQRSGVEGSSRPHSTDTNRPRYHHQGGKNGYGQNGARAEKRPPPPPKQQRVPNADEFPVLAGTNTPPTRNTGLNGLANGHTGPTAAQVLSAPAPVRKDATSKDSSTRGPSPESKSAPAPSKAESNGATAEAAPATMTHDHPAPVKLPISFAAVAAPELPKEIALSA
ncbi:hypothetical protein C0995_004254 [Termitomyces sp. Mi166|nr:hypothetical protein C0995_004254 [Termitomyces sp. Mi166\